MKRFDLLRPSKHIILILFFALTCMAIGQSFNNIVFNDLNTKQARFIGGNDELEKFFASNMRYPIDNNYGTMIGIIIIDQEKKELNTLTINSLGKSYENEFKRVAKLTKDKWESDDSVKIVYATLTLEFGIVENTFFVDYDNQPKFIAGNIFLRTYSNINLIPDEKLVQSLNDSYSQKDYKKVLSLTKELIKRNPLYPNFFVMRITALKEQEEDLNEELWILTEFLNKQEYINLKNN